MADGVIDHQRVVGVLAILQQRGAADAGMDVRAAMRIADLVARDRAAGGEGEIVDQRALADVGDQGRDMQRAVALAADLDMIELALPRRSTSSSA